MNRKLRLTGATTLVLAVVLAALTAEPVAAQSRIPEQIDLETAVALALQSNLGIESELLAVRQKKLIADTWWNRFYPQANASVTLGRLNEEPAAGPLQPDPSRWFMSAGLNLSLDLTLQTFPGISLARMDYEMGLLSLADARRQIERDVSKQFYNLLLAREQIALVEERIATAQRRYNQAQINFNNGLIDEFTLLSAQVGVETQRPALEALRGGYQQQLLSFRNSLGLPLHTRVEPIGEIDPPTVTLTGDNLDEQILRQRLDIQQLLLLEQIRQEQLRINDFSQGGRVPFVRFGLTVDPTFQGNPWQDSWFDGDNWSQRSGAFTVTIVQPLTAWLPFSQQRNQAAETEMEIARNRISIDQLLRGAEIGVQGLLLGIRTSLQTSAALEENIRLARRAYELAEIGYNNGLRELLEVQNAEVDLKDAEFQLLQEQKNIMDNLLDLVYELNVSMDEITTEN